MMPTPGPRAFPRVVSLFLLTAGLVPALRAEAAADAKAAQADDAETVCIVSHVKKGRAEQYAAEAVKTWELYRSLDVVLPKPHVLLRGVEEGGNAYFIEIFTWRSSDTPDHAPKAITDAWAKLGAECESRSGRPPMEVSDGGVNVVTWE